MPRPVNGVDRPQVQAGRLGDNGAVGNHDGDVLHPVGVDRVRHGDVVDERHGAGAVELETGPQHTRREERPRGEHCACLLEEEAQVDEGTAAQHGPLEQVLPQTAGHRDVVLVGADEARRTFLLEQAPGGIPQQLLVVAEREIHQFFPRIAVLLALNQPPVALTNASSASGT